MAQTTRKDRKLPDRLELEFTVADESLNRKGWRLKVDGVHTENFMKNPVCMVQHDTWSMPVGKWTSITKEKGVMKGRVELDANDERAVSLYWKYVDGYMSAVSISVWPIAESDSREELLPGQRYSTVIESELLEISLVSIPANSNAVKLCHEDGSEYSASLLMSNSNSLRMDKKDEKTVEQLQAELLDQKRLNASNLVELHRQRKVVSEGEVEPLKELAMADYASVEKMLKARVAPVEQGAGEQKSPAQTLAAALVDQHVRRGAITEAERNVYELAAAHDYENVRKTLEAKQGADGIMTFVQGMGSQTPSTGQDRDAWTYMDYFKRDAAALSLMEKSEPQKYKALVSAFEAECRQNSLVID